MAALGVPADQTGASVEHLASLQGVRVLELGCGHGLPGILALLGGALVTFHVRSLRSQIYEHARTELVVALLLRTPHLLWAHNVHQKKSVHKSENIDGAVPYLLTRDCVCTLATVPMLPVWHAAQCL
jgi:hypothetical protein